MNRPIHISPPKVPLKFLKWFCHPDLIEDVEGDLSELFALRYEENKAKARLLFSLDVLLLFRPGIIKNLAFNNGQTQISMFSNYLKIAIRNALRYKGYTALNLLGLIVGIASSILILLWVDDEVSMDKFHEKGDEIYQVFRNMRQSNGMVSTTSSIPKPLGDLVKAEYSEVDQVAWLSWSMSLDIVMEDQAIEEEGRFVNPEFLEMFSFDLIIGDRSSALDQPNNLMISKAVAEKYFGANWRETAPGQTLRVEGAVDAIVTGIFEDIGDNSTIQFDWLLPVQAFVSANDWVNDWGNGSFDTFIAISDPDKVESVEDRILMEIKDHTEGNPNAGDEELIIHKFQDTYLYSKFENGVVAGGRIDYVRIMSVVAVFILIVACINFMNLTTARSSRRSKEIGLRKVMGAQRRSISIQFFFEAITLTALAVAISVLLVLVLLPNFNQLVNKSLAVDFTQVRTWYFLIGLILGVGLLSGSYPALLLPNFKVVESMKGGVIKQSSFASYFRKGLVVFQFAISTLLIIGTAMVYKQMAYILNKDLGMDKENLVAIPMETDLIRRFESYKTELLRIPEVSSVTASSGNPLNYGRSTSSADWEGKNPSEGHEINVILCERDFFTTTGMEILQGRGFSQELEDSTNFVVNEVAAQIMGFDDPINKKLSFWGIEGKIVGVVKNFHMRDLYQPIAPLIITCYSLNSGSIALVKIDRNAGAVMPAIEEVTKQMTAGADFQYQFLDQAYADQYENERTLSTLANIFAIISILISSLGLLGLASYSAEQRSREIGVRKVHGASVNQILVLLSKDYSKLILIAFILAVPVGYYVTQNWLNNFEFRTNLDPFLFVIAGLITFAIGVFTVTAKSYQAATANPVNSLKEE